MIAIISLLLLGVTITVANECEGVYPPDCGDVDGCVQFFEGCIPDEFPDPSTTASDDNCDDDRDAHNWRIDWIGSSTQFRLYDPCDGDWVKFKMESLTEYGMKKGKQTKTGNKETSFASANWKWGEGGGYTTFNGYNAIVNKYNASRLSKMDASLIFTTVFFREDAVVNNVTVNRNALKFSIEIGGWDYEDDGNYLEMCIDILTKGSKGPVGENDDGSVDMNGFAVSNEEQATCEGGDNMDVTVNLDGNMKNHLTICYVFEETCDSGNIFYDPILRSTNPTNSAVTSSFAFASLFVILSVFTL